jgi:hypothetical protein
MTLLEHGQEVLTALIFWFATRCTGSRDGLHPLGVGDQYAR